MSIKVDADLDGAKQQIAAIKQRLEHLKPVLEVQAETLRSAIVRQSFGRSQGMNDEVWPPLSETTLERRRGNTAKPLIDTGALRQAVNTRATSTSVLFGVSGAPARYAPTHQFGTQRVPRRPFLPLDDAGKPQFTAGAAARWHEKMRAAVRRWIVEGK